MLKAFEFYFLETLSSNNNLTKVYKEIAKGDMKEIDDMFKKQPKDSPITDYNPKWTKPPTPKKLKQDNDKQDKKKPKISWETF